MRIAWNRIFPGLVLTAMVVAVGVFVWNVVGVDVSIGLGRKVADGRARWQQVGGNSYRAVVRVIDYNQTVKGNVTVVVKDGELVEAQRGDTALPREEAANYTIEALFDYASVQLADVPHFYVTTGMGYHYLLTVNSDLGYIEEFKLDLCGHGPLASQTTDCRWGFDVLDVRLGD